MAVDKEQLSALSTLLDQAGLDASDLLTAITTLAKAKQVAQEKQETEDKASVLVRMSLIKNWCTQMKKQLSTNEEM